MSELLELKSVTKSFGGVKALQGISLSVKDTEILGLIGPNGSGKTTLFNIISGFLKPDKGRIYYQGKDITRLSPHKRAKLGIGRLFQDIRIFDKLTVIDNILLARGNESEGVLASFVKTPIFNKRYKSRELENAHSLLDFVGLQSKQNGLAQNLSYGQEKLLAVAMLLARDSRLILLDEPISGLDLKMRDMMLTLIKRLKELGKTIIVIEHSLDFLFDISERVIILSNGYKVYEGNPDKIKNNSALLTNVYLNANR